MAIRRSLERWPWRGITGAAVLWFTATGFIAAAPAGGLAPACLRTPAPAVCADPQGARTPLCLLLMTSGEFGRGGIGSAGISADLGKAIEALPELGERLSAGTLIGCRLLTSADTGPAQQVLGAALNDAVRIMDGEGRSAGAALPLIDLAQVQFAADFEADAIRSLAAFEWAVGDMSSLDDAAHVLALGGSRLAEIGQRGRAGRLFAAARAKAERMDSSGSGLRQRIAALEAEAGLTPAAGWIRNE